ncbi:MAG: glycine cleavage system protein GcvH [Candidatus Nanopelagicales bacterium]|jgi:glycine cleavage system H protein
MNTPENLRYTKEHEWVIVEGDTVTFGITDFAQDALGDIVFISLPKTGSKIVAGDTCGEVESTKSVSDIFAPVSGEVVEVNDSLTATPEVVNQDPYESGWMVKVQLSGALDESSLLSATDYEALTKG